MPDAEPGSALAGLGVNGAPKHHGQTTQGLCDAFQRLCGLVGGLGHDLCTFHHVYLPELSPLVNSCHARSGVKGVTSSTEPFDVLDMPIGPAMLSDYRIAELLAKASRETTTGTELMLVYRPELRKLLLEVIRHREAAAKAPKAGVVIITAAHEFQTIRPEDTPEEFIEALVKELGTWRVSWRPGLSMPVGHSDYRFTKKEAEALADGMNTRYPDINHWAEMMPE
jgi:hypothetical protein